MDKSHADHGAVDLQDDTDPPVAQDAADQFAVQDSIDHHYVQAGAVEHLAALAAEEKTLLTRLLWMYLLLRS